MKKLLIAVDTYYPKTDGVVRYLEYITPRLEKFFDATIVAPKYSKEKIFGVEEFIYTIPFSFMGYSPAIPSLSLLKKIYSSDILFVQDLAVIGIQTIIGGKILKKPIAFFCHHDEALMIVSILRKSRFLKKIGEERIRKVVDKIVSKFYEKVDLFFVATMRFYKKLKRLGIQDDGIVFNPFSVDTEKFKPRDKEKCREILGLPKEKKIVLYVGRISPEKNVETLLEAARELKDLLFLVVGKGPKLAEYRKKYNLENVNFMGYQPDEKLPIIYSSSDIFVHPSLHESQSFTTLEAMASGIPVIVRREEGEYSIYNRENAVFIENPLDKNEIIEKIKFLIKNEDIAIEIGKKARKTILRYSWERHVRVLKENFERLVDAGAGI